MTQQTQLSNQQLFENHIINLIDKRLQSSVKNGSKVKSSYHFSFPNLNLNVKVKIHQSYWLNRLTEPKHLNDLHRIYQLPVEVIVWGELIESKLRQKNFSFVYKRNFKKIYDKSFVKNDKAVQTLTVTIKQTKDNRFKPDFKESRTLQIIKSDHEHPMMFSYKIPDKYNPYEGIVKTFIATKIGTSIKKLGQLSDVCDKKIVQIYCSSKDVVEMQNAGIAFDKISQIKLSQLNDRQLKAIMKKFFTQRYDQRITAAIKHEIGLTKMHLKSGVNFELVMRSKLAPSNIDFADYKLYESTEQFYDKLSLIEQDILNLYQVFLKIISAESASDIQNYLHNTLKELFNNTFKPSVRQ